MKPGTLVKVNPKASSRGAIYLTPDHDDAEDVSSWPEWRPEDIGVVLPTGRSQIGILVMTPTGTGLCFYDELLEIK